MTYVRRLRTRGYETDRTRLIPVGTVMSYLEHLRWEVIQEPELGLVDALHAGHFFVVGRQSVELVRRVGLGVDLELTCRLLECGRSVAKVEHRVTRASDGALVAHAHVVGFWIGPNRRLARIPDPMRAVTAEHAALEVAEPSIGESAPGPDPAQTTSFVAPGEVVLGVEGVDLEIPEDPPPPGAFRQVVRVRPSDIDIFDHVNAATYLDLCEDVRVIGASLGELPAATRGEREPAARAALSYHREALVGDAITVSAWALAEDAYGFELRRDRDDEVLVRARVETR